VETIKAMPGLSEADKEKILGGNSMRLFGLSETGTPRALMRQR
jgi:predicted TIM-barrel fold metal-dependent hydrolase